MERYEIVAVPQGDDAEIFPELVIDLVDEDEGGDEAACERVWQLRRDVRDIPGAAHYYVRPVAAT